MRRKRMIVSQMPLLISTVTFPFFSLPSSRLFSSSVFKGSSTTALPPSLPPPGSPTWPSSLSHRIYSPALPLLLSFTHSLPMHSSKSQHPSSHIFPFHTVPFSLPLICPSMSQFRSFIIPPTCGVAECLRGTWGESPGEKYEVFVCVYVLSFQSPKISSLIFFCIL